MNEAAHCSISWYKVPSLQQGFLYILNTYEYELIHYSERQNTKCEARYFFFSPLSLWGDCGAGRLLQGCWFDTRFLPMGRPALCMSVNGWMWGKNCKTLSVKVDKCYIHLLFEYLMLKNVHIQHRQSMFLRYCSVSIIIKNTYFSFDECCLTAYSIWQVPHAFLGRQIMIEFILMMALKGLFVLMNCFYLLFWHWELPTTVSYRKKKKLHLKIQTTLTFRIAKTFYMFVPTYESCWSHCTVTWPGNSLFFF